MLAVLLVATSALAQAVCGKRAEIIKRLHTGYAEVEVGAGIAQNGNLVEVFASQKGGWSIIYTTPSGITCMMAVGENWMMIENPFAVETGAP